MKKSMFLVALFIGVAATALAQTNETVTETQTVKKSEVSKENSFWNNTFVSVGVGGQMLFSDHDKQMSFGDRLSPALEIAVGKWFTPGIGARLMYTGWSLNEATQKNGPHSWQESEIKYFNLHADAMFNLSDLVWHNEKWNCSPYVGLGLMRAYSGNTCSKLGLNLGIYNAYRLSDVLDLNFDVRGTLVGDSFDGVKGGRGGEGVLSATVGLTYKFKAK